ncbi:hypothetical protein [Desulfobaculum bizertense]|uniref:Lipoprotein n=1 Tax=Desulfobaculum bizertense DSM 18034 TaxID=1121442 RepID=A0A1T4WC40_9BACT|nr:hypothetical protein [Desulfobaculum bizertense]UIJ37459.1 hypothetical protein LWC08_12150 [Desulfobaculum bizertense]SKA74757.1 hypothetical protein SAMN02745702_02027 [Desulfobaculum bizertense DSM 18034]
MPRRYLRLAILGLSLVFLLGLSGCFPGRYVYDNQPHYEKGHRHHKYKKHHHHRRHHHPPRGSVYIY